MRAWARGRSWLARRLGRAYGRARARLAEEITAEDALEWRCMATQPSPSPRRLRILYVAMRHDYGDSSRGLSYEEHAFYHSLLMLGHEMLRFDPVATAERAGHGSTSRMLREVAYRYTPDLMFTVLFQDDLDPAVVREISSSAATITFNWFADDHWRYERFSRRWAPAFNWVGTTSRAAFDKYRRDGLSNVLQTQWACNAYLYRPLDLPKTIDVSFVGQPHGNRRAVIDRLRAAGIGVQTFGLGWPAGRITQREVIEIFNRSKINLNLSNASRGETEQVKGRDFEVPGCGGFLLTKSSPEIEAYYNVGREIACYESVDDLVDKIRHYLARDAERDAIAAAGYRRTMLDHTYAHRFSALFDRMRLFTEPART
jgi:spore maturation protein CgeB